MWVLIDNYDSFTHILYHYLLLTGNSCQVFRNDEISIEQLEKTNPERIVISPGPETPLQAGITMNVIDYFHNKVPILGICLGHQAIGMYFGARLYQINYPMHGKISEIHYVPHPVFNDIPQPFNAMRYHSLAVNEFKNTQLDILAQTTDGTIMAMAHKVFPCMGFQFHPESIGTDYGMKLLHNWAQMKL